MLNTSIYEFPLNERIRNFMRLENSFAQIAHFAARDNIWDSQASLLVLLDVLSCMEKHDIKNEMIKEAERQIGILNNFLDAPVVFAKLEQTLGELNTHLSALQNITGKVAKNLRDDDLLNTIRQRTSLFSGINNFEIPGYYYWLNQKNNLRQQQLDEWLADSIPIADAISLLLEIIRESAEFAPKTAENGFFQTTFNSNLNCQMLRLALPMDAACFPESSGNKHRVSIRFLTYENTKQRPQQVTENIAFNLSCCGI